MPRGSSRPTPRTKRHQHSTGFARAVRQRDAETGGRRYCVWQSINQSINHSFIHSFIQSINLVFIEAHDKPHMPHTVDKSMLKRRAEENKQVQPTRASTHRQLTSAASPQCRARLTPTEDDGIAYSEFNITGNSPIVIRITPQQPDRVDVYLKRDRIPTTTDYDWYLSSWDFVEKRQSSWDNADNYTVTLDADLFKDTTQLYVGVRSPTGISTIHR